MEKADITPRVSIIIPIYNAEKFLRECMNSILRQSFTDFEVILVNDGSKDASRQICEEYSKQDSRIILINQHNAGVDKARNAGLAVMRGEFVTFMDSDDWAETDWLQSYMDIQTSGFSCDLLVQGLVVDSIHTFRKKFLPGKRYEKQKVIDGVILLEEHSISGFVHNKMYRASIIKEHNLFFEFTLKEDLLFNLKYCSYICSLAILPKACYHYMQRTCDSLIKRRYPPLYMLSLCIALKEAGLKLADKYKSSSYTRFTWDRCLTNYVVLLASMYKRPHAIGSKVERIKLISGYQHERKENPDISPTFYERSKKIFAKLVLLPPGLCDRLCSTIFSHSARY